jgi:hypothetical protein
MTYTREMILAAVEDLVSDLLYYNRKYDEDLPRGEIEKAIANEIVTVDELVERFKATLIEDLGV